MQTRLTANLGLISPTSVRPRIAAAIAACSLLCSGLPAHADASISGKTSVRSVHTELRGKSCKRTADSSDPNDTPYLICAGASGYTLILRHVDAGRLSIDVVDPHQHAFPLDYQGVVTRHMFSLGSKAEWRVTTVDGKIVPIALIVAVRAHESDNDPGKATNSYFIISKITKDSVCVTDRLPGSRVRTAVRNAADTAAGRDCLPPQPSTTRDGVLVR